MSILRRILGPSVDKARYRDDEAALNANAANPSPEPFVRTPPETLVSASNVCDIVRVEQTTDAEFYVGDLFRRRFGADPPSYPLHFVAFYRQFRTHYLPVGYIHYTSFEDTYLCGGLVIDDRLYRRIPAEHRKLIRVAGGIAELMLRDTFARFGHSPAIWGHVGDKQAEEVNLRVGFRRTDHPHVMVVWNAELPPEERTARLERVIALGPF